MYAFVKMSSGWYGKKNMSILDVKEHVSCGVVVAFAEDVETFASEMGLEIDEIHMD